MKPFWKSKTLWFNVLTLVVGVVDGSYGITGLTAEQTAVIVAVGNIILRVLTTTPVKVV